MRPRRSLLTALGATLCVATLVTSACFGGGQEPAKPTPITQVQATPAASPPPPPPPRPSPSPSPSPSPTGPETSYTVTTGDTLASIAEKVYGDASLWRRIYDANRQAIGDNPDNIVVGTQLRIPPKP